MRIKSRVKSAYDDKAYDYYLWYGRTNSRTKRYHT